MLAREDIDWAGNGSNGSMPLAAETDCAVIIGTLVDVGWLEALTLLCARIAMIERLVTLRTLLPSALSDAVVEGIDFCLHFLGFHMHRPEERTSMKYVRFRSKHRLIVNNPNSTLDTLHDLQPMALTQATTSSAHSPSASPADS